MGVMRPLPQRCNGRPRTAYNPCVIKTVTKIAVAVVVVLCALVYAGDYVSARFHIPKGSGTLSTVEVQPYYAVPLKGGKTEFMFLQPENQTCVNSLFPHQGHNPCWYVRRHRDKPVNI